MTAIIMRPAGVEESMPSVTDTRVTPRSISSLTVWRMCIMFAAKPVTCSRSEAIAQPLSRTE